MTLLAFAVGVDMTEEIVFFGVGVVVVVLLVAGFVYIGKLFRADSRE